MKTFYKKTEESYNLMQKKLRRDAWNSGNKDGSRTGQKEDSKALVTVDGEGVDWTHHSEDEDYALMACNSSDSDTEHRNKSILSGLKKVKHSSVSHQQGTLWHMTRNKTTLLIFKILMVALLLLEATPLKLSSSNLVKTVSLPISPSQSFMKGLTLSVPTNPEEDRFRNTPLEETIKIPLMGFSYYSSFDDEGAWLTSQLGNY
ncbi:hypothetical protein Tco_0746303 [Tanacetum coccineum]